MSKFSHLRGIPFPEVNSTSVKLLIGQDNPDALVPLESRRGERNQPYAVRTPLGWTINGPLHREKIPGQLSLTLCSSRALRLTRTLYITISRPAGLIPAVIFTVCSYSECSAGRYCHPTPFVVLHKKLMYCRPSLRP